MLQSAVLLYPVHHSSSSSEPCASTAAHGTSLKELLRGVALVPLDGDVGRVAIGDEKQRAAVVAQGSEDELE